MRLGSINVTVGRIGGAAEVQMSVVPTVDVPLDDVYYMAQAWASPTVGPGRWNRVTLTFREPLPGAYLPDLDVLLELPEDVDAGFLETFGPLDLQGKLAPHD